MLKCLECGFEAPRLQWTHFKYNCTGRFKNGREYMVAYPGAKVVSPELAKKTAVTLETLINKWGEKEGKKRWKEYKNKQAYSNTLEYKKEKHGWSEKEFTEYNKTRAATLNNMVKRHGEEQGLVKWQEYCDRQAFTNTLEYFIEREGNREKGLETWLKINQEKAKVQDPKYIMQKYNVSFDEALEILSSQRTNSFVSDAEKQFVDWLEKELGYEFKYTYKTRQFCKWSNELHQPVFYDVVDPILKICIEFNGDYWHCRPKNWFKNRKEIHPYFKKTPEEIWKFEIEKRKIMKNLGYKCIIVWWSDWINRNTNILELLKNENN